MYLLYLYTIMKSSKPFYFIFIKIFREWNRLSREFVQHLLSNIILTSSFIVLTD